MLFSEQIIITSTTDYEQFTSPVNLTQYTGNLFFAVENVVEDKIFYSTEYSIDGQNWYRLTEFKTRELGSNEKSVVAVDMELIQKMPYVRLGVYCYSAANKTIEMSWGVI